MGHQFYSFLTILNFLQFKNNLIYSNRQLNSKQLLFLNFFDLINSNEKCS